ncbi:MAG: hypothetical protein FWE18_05800 [Alphaproteobacteria bacterium]|nr:hypothetical protein [Alphaproteobacteria bacterium]
MPVYLDSYIHKTISSNVIDSLEIFEGETLSVLYGNSYLGDFKVINGSITVAGNSYADSNVIVGYGFASVYTTPNLETDSSMVKIDKADLVFYKSSHIDVLNSTGSILQRNILAKTAPMAEYQNIMLNINGSWESNANLSIQQYLPFAMNIVAVNLNLNILNK